MKPASALIIANITGLRIVRRTLNALGNTILNDLQHERVQSEGSSHQKTRAGMTLTSVCG